MDRPRCPEDAREPARALRSGAACRRPLLLLRPALPGSAAAAAAAAAELFTASDTLSFFGAAFSSAFMDSRGCPRAGCGQGLDLVLDGLRVGVLLPAAPRAAPPFFASKAVALVLVLGDVVVLVFLFVVVVILLDLVVVELLCWSRVRFGMVAYGDDNLLSNLRYFRIC